MEKLEPDSAANVALQREIKKFFETNPEADYVYKRFSKMIGEVMTVLDAVLPTGSQLINAKKLMNKAMYDARTEITEKLPPPYGVKGTKFLQPKQ